MDIVEELRHDREAGAKRLETEYKAGLMALARRFCPDPGDAEELVNSTFAEVVENVDDFLEQSSLFTWMCKILTSKFSHATRRKANQLETFPGTVPDVCDESALEEIYANLDASLLRSAVDRLTDEQREVIVLRYFTDMPIAKIAKFLSIPSGTVRSRLHYARLALAEKLGATIRKTASTPRGKVVLLALALCGIAAFGAALAGLAVSGEEQDQSRRPFRQADVEAAPDFRGSGDSSDLPDPSGMLGLMGMADYTGNSGFSREQTMNALKTTRSAAIAAGAMLAAASAAELEQRDSSQFDYKYEMLELPTAEDLDKGGAADFTGNGSWLSLGTGSDLGTIKIDASTNGKYLISNQNSGTAGDGWRSLGASSSSGFTVETRLKVTECTGNNGAICVEAGPSDSKVYARLNFFDGSIGWNGTTLTNLDTSVWHTYRITRKGGTTVHSVWVDGVLVAENLGTGFTYNNSTLYRMLLGSPGNGWTGKAQVAYLRFCKNAYAPLDPNDKSRRKASAEFDSRYEMGADDARFAASGNAKASGTDWTATVGASPSVSLNGKLSMNPNGKNTAYWAAKDAVWKSVVTPSTPYTVEFSAKINSCNIDGIDRTLQFMTGTTGPVGSLFVGTNSVSWQVDSSMGHNIVLDTNDNTDAFHSFRIAYSGAGRHAFTVWRDEEKIGQDLVDCTNFYAWQNGSALAIVRFGVVSTSTHGGAFDIDYIRWETGKAWEWKKPPAAFTMVVR